MMTSLPRFALSVRQPWAWAIVYAGKDIENRSIFALRHMPIGVGPLAIHASKGMTRDEYDLAADFMRSLGVTCPLARELTRGAIIGAVHVAGIVRESPSKWWMGPRGIVFTDPQACEPIPATGRLGLFEWRPNGGACEPPARWMLAGRPSKSTSAQGALGFDDRARGAGK